jgi:hypothetical protein
MPNTTTADDIITAITAAPTAAVAQSVMALVTSRTLILAIADQLYIEVDGCASGTLRKEIVKEARA